MLDGCTPWPGEFVDRYWLSGHWRGRTLDGLLRDAAKTDPARTALVHAGTRLTYGQLNRRVERTAAGFKLIGVMPRQRVVVQLPPVPEFVITVFALLRMGAVPVICPLSYRAEETARVVRVAQALCYVGPATYDGFDHRAVAADIAQGPFLRRVFTWEPPGAASALGGATVDEVGCHYFPLASVDAAPEPMPHVAAGDVALLLVSDGQHLVPRTHNDLACQARTAAEAVGLGPQDVCLVAGDAASAAGFACPGLVGALGAGATVVLAEGAAEVASLVAEEGVTVVAGVSRSELASGGIDLSGVLVVEELLHGSVEGVALRGGPGGALRPLSAEDEVRVAGADGTEVPVGEVGELQVRGPSVVRGYYRGAGGERFCADGFFRTGESVRRQDDGSLLPG
ncbi:AMP-binding protein [Streptomyces indicus]|uniref:2,3-dihydroxybenzoate-AMP ligase n=1 Tax=Streptomyces indicus TaxID=417292 RepID=A0A1G9D5W8_9ACTN|nr:AMP-binding protein [Streptomyces indicus]SDK59318.1 2,3-dihydroxybenzoate-AMP ligase [Streptomyces indicus]